MLIGKICDVLPLLEHFKMAATKKYEKLEMGYIPYPNF